MAITFKCGCGREITVKDEFAGRKGKCPACGMVVLVPAPVVEPVAPQEPAVEEPEPAAEPEPVEAGPTKACMHCRKQIAADAKFCVHCGTNLRSGKKHTTEHGAGEDEYDFIKTAPDMVTKPMDAVGRIVEAEPTAANFQKALAVFALGTAVFTYAVTRVGATAGGYDIAWWMYLLTAALAVAATIVWGMLAGMAGTMFGQTGVAFANTFMAVIAARAMLGFLMVLPILLLFALSGTPEFARYTALLIRVLGGAGMMYVIIYRAHDCGHTQASVFAGISAAVDALLFWLGGLAFGYFILDKSLTLI